MNDTIMVKVFCGRDSLYIRTISRKGKSPVRFCILRSEFQKLEQNPNNQLIVSDCDSFARLRLIQVAEGLQILEIYFTWLQKSNNNVSGTEEIIRLPYKPFHDFVESDTDTSGSHWCQLSIKEEIKQKFEFQSVKNLHEVVKSSVLRHKLGKFLEKSFQWKGTEKIVIYDDWQSFSFFFREITKYGDGICGGIILHDAENLSQAEYSIHT